MEKRYLYQLLVISGDFAVFFYYYYKSVNGSIL